MKKIIKKIIKNARRDDAVPPSATIRESMKFNGIKNARALAQQLGVTLGAAENLLTDWTEIDEIMAVYLERLFTTPASFWLNLSRNYWAAKSGLTPLAREFLNEYGPEHFPQRFGPWQDRCDTDPMWKVDELKQMAKLGFIELQTAPKNVGGWRWRFTMKGLEAKEAMV